MKEATKVPSAATTARTLVAEAPKVKVPVVPVAGSGVESVAGVPPPCWVKVAPVGSVLNFTW
jgi:hypothetical protein